MFEVRNNIHLLIVMYVVICLAIWYAKPDIMFNNGEVKPHGLGKNKNLIQLSNSYHYDSFNYVLYF